MVEEDLRREANAFLQNMYDLCSQKACVEFEQMRIKQNLLTQAIVIKKGTAKQHKTDPYSIKQKMPFANGAMNDRIRPDSKKPNTKKE